MSTTVVRMVTALALVVGLSWVGPIAGACACGAMEPSDQRGLGVNSETAAILFDGQTETVALSMGLETDSSGVAFLLPLPAKAELEVAGAHSYDLRFWLAGDSSGGAPEEAGVEVVGRQQVGDYDVVQLSGDGSAVGAWLSDNGFRTRDEVLSGLDHYLQQGWIVLAVKLAFEGDQFQGGTAPLLVRFPTTELVYPMRLSALAESAQQVRFYVFADHRQEVTIGGRALDTSFAGWVDAEAFGEAGHEQAAALVGERRWFLTRIDDQVVPEEVTGDLEFAPAPEGDVEHREVIWRTEQRGGLVVLGIVGLVVVLVAATAVVSVLSHRRARRRWRDAHAGPLDPTG